MKPIEDEGEESYRFEILGFQLEDSYSQNLYSVQFISHSSSSSSFIVEIR